MLLLQQRAGLLERLELRHLAPGSRRRGFGGPTPDHAVAHILPPLGQHEGMDLQRRCDGLHLQARLLTEPDGGARTLGSCNVR
jgi:hypothetical protein